MINMREGWRQREVMGVRPHEGQTADRTVTTGKEKRRRSQGPLGNRIGKACPTTGWGRKGRKSEDKLQFPA